MGKEMKEWEDCKILMERCLSSNILTRSYCKKYYFVTGSFKILNTIQMCII